MHVKVTTTNVIITLERFIKPRESKSKKMLLIGSTGGWQKSSDATVEIDGELIVVRFSAMAGVMANEVKVEEKTPTTG